jgi:flavodoxin
LKSIVVYYSLSGNTRFVAEKIAEQLEAELSEVLDKKYGRGRFVYLTGGLAAYRQKMTTIDVSKSVEDYDLTIIGSPVWAGKITPAIRTFLKRNDFSNKHVAFFVTLGGNNREKPLRNLRETVEVKSTIEGLAISAPLENRERTEAQVKEWCNQLKSKVFG